MYHVRTIISVVIIVFILKSLIIFAHESDVGLQTITLAANIGDQNFTTPENVPLTLNVKNLAFQDPEGSCTGWCIVNAKTIIPIICQRVHEKDSTYISVKLVNNVTRQCYGEWECQFNTTSANKPNLNHSLQELEPNKDPAWCRFRLSNVQTQETETLETYFTTTTIIIVLGISVFMLVINIGQTICIIHFKRKANAISRHANLMKKNASTESMDRYSMLPAQNNKAEPCQEARESVIYEALDTIQASSVEHRTPAPAEPRVNNNSNTSTLLRTLSNAITNSLTRNKKKKAQSDLDSKRSTLDRIKERAPLPAPNDEIYEDMECTPNFPRQELVNAEVKIKNEFRDFSTHPRQNRQPPVLAPNFVSGAKSLQLQLSSQLKQELRSRVNTAPHDSTPSKFTPFNPGLPPCAPQSRLAPVTPRAEKVALSNTRRVETPPMLRKGTPTSNNPGVPKPKLPPPTKPKPTLPPTQLHRLSPPQLTQRSEPIHVITKGAAEEYDSDEEWTYEPLDKYNIYNN